MSAQYERPVRVVWNNHLGARACSFDFNPSSSNETTKATISFCAVYTSFIELQRDELLKELHELDRNNPNDHDEIEEIRARVAKIQAALPLVNNYGDEPFTTTNMDEAYTLVNALVADSLHLMIKPTGATNLTIAINQNGTMSVRS